MIHHIISSSSKHGHLFNLIATPVTRCQGWQSGSNIHILATPVTPSLSGVAERLHPTYMPYSLLDRLLKSNLLSTPQGYAKSPHALPRCLKFKIMIRCAYARIPRTQVDISRLMRSPVLECNVVSFFQIMVTFLLNN